MSPEIITNDCRPMTPGERLRAYLERREYALAAGHGVTCEVIVPVAEMSEPAITTEAEAEQVATNISKFLRRKGGAK